jgi:HK97 family phage major capsid protein
LTAKKMTALAKYSTELAEDAIINIADDLAYEIGYAFAKAEDEAGFIGTGTSTYGGIVGVSAALTNKFTSTTTTSNGVVIGSGNLMSEITAGDLLAVMQRLPQWAAEDGCAWFCSRFACWGVFHRLATTVAAGMAQTPATLTSPLPMQYGGFPIVIAQAMPASDTNSQIICFLGNLNKGATMGVRRDIVISVTDQVYWANDQFGIKGSQRIDINVHDVGDGTNAGAVVGLRAAAS